MKETVVPIDPPGLRGDQLPQYDEATVDKKSGSVAGKRNIDEANKNHEKDILSELKSDLDKAEKATSIFEKRWKMERTKRLRTEGMLECVNAAVNQFLEY